MTDLTKQFWDHYSKIVKRDGDYWPGDEWGAADRWDANFAKFFLSFGAASWKRAVEIGAGSGKYTTRLLRSAPEAHVLAADISSGFQKVFQRKLSEEGLIDRTTPVIIKPNSGSLRQHIEAAGWTGQFDAMYSIDAMVHVDLQYIIAYLITAGACLRPGGKLVMTFSNCLTDGGFAKLIAETPRMFAQAGQKTAKFEWMSPDIVSGILPRLNFDIDLLDTHGRDIWTIATLREPITDSNLLDAIK